ncbi:hypothetical protein APS56_04835 [Pseudalgibacter alginicilyticus]|uniref:Uncharacterized protein n=1 Tax=Pseudalgibacter alginicilyticus TaxID=1736674 RepID=A0A0P0D3G2_9FLAO|nr:hypothetical protein [Pseudalgibacter alginicilyticus]ALJ04505.1 hypothetical protein APS56_04835 [Pseudalgibacter alginicilyticus]
MRRIFLYLNLALIISACEGQIVKNEKFKLGLKGKDVVVERNDGSLLEFKPIFTVIYSEENPGKKLRYGDFGYNKKPYEEIGVRYHIPTWGKSEKVIIDPKEHVMDGFNPEIDRGLEENRTSNMFNAGISKTLIAEDVVVNGDLIQWIFPKNNLGVLKAYVTINQDEDYPSIHFDFTAKKEGYYSIGYIGAPEFDITNCDEIWQSDIWSEKRFPNAPYLSESYRTKLPSTFVSHSGTTYGLVGAPEHIPFMPMPTTNNSQFGVMVRNPKGLAQSSIFSPVLGGVNSKMEANNKYEFKAYMFILKDNIDKAFEECAYNIYNFSDIRRNATTTLNKTFENMVDYCMSKYGAFNEELRGSDYSSDVPGAVKNISGLHPLSIAHVTDNIEIFKKRARPMIEYGLTRERFLFSTNSEIIRDGTSSKLKGPGVPMSDLTTTFTYSKNRMSHFLNVAKKIYKDKVNRSLNLDAMLYGDRWQNSMYLYRATGEKLYLKDAIRKADEYLDERVYKKQTTFSDEHSRGLFFWTSYTNQYMELYLMYLTTGDKKYLDAAYDGIRQYTRFCWVSPKIPESMVTVNVGDSVPRYRSHNRWITMRIPEEAVEAWRVSEHGLTPESTPTSDGHRAIFMANYAPFMMRIAAETGDKFLHDMARNAVIGRYENFPGYHINAGRTTAFEKYDFPLRSFEELNGHTSMHFNHPWSMVASLMDYMMAEAYYASDKKINMKPEYAEGYAYCRSLIYGANSGTFYKDKGVIPYMPKQLLETDNLQLNYIAARGNNKLYVAFTNQYKDEVNATITFDLEKAGIEKDRTYKCQVWKDNIVVEEKTLVNGKINIDVSPKGITAIAIVGAEPMAEFQKSLMTSTPVWSKDFSQIGFHDDQAVIFNMGKGLSSVYFMTAANNDIFNKVTVKYSFNEGEWQSVSRVGYPYEFTIDINDNTKIIEYQFEGLDLNGKTIKSKIGTLSK